MKPRMKWYWRVLISVGSGALITILSYLIYGRQIDAVLYGRAAQFGWAMSIVINMVAYGIFSGGVVLAVYHRLTEPRWVQGQTFCGRCGYILKGLTEPRCSECGKVL